jgi:peroxiredoxin
VKLPIARFAIVASLFGAAALAAVAEEPAPQKAVGIGEVLPPFEAKDVDGASFSLATARTITEADAAASVAAAAKSFGAPDAKATTAIDALPGVAKDGKPDPAKRAAFVQAAWKSWGLVATPATTKDLVTLGDVAKKIVASADAPIVFFAWSSGCPTCTLYYDRFLEIFSTSGARVFPFAANHDDPIESIRATIAARDLPYRILLDPEAKLADALGARTTPHTFVLDGKNVLRYSGSPDSDPALDGDATKRISYLKDALAAVSAGRQVEIRVTLPKG